MIQNIESSNIIENKKESSNKDINKNNNKNKFLYLEKLEKRAKNKLIKRYDKPIWYHDVKMINDILYNEKTHYVEMFKEYLIYEDYNEFLKQYYSDPLLSKKLEKILIFYEKYSKIFPNYTVIKESKYLYKNIKRKQKMINQMNENKKRENYSEEDNYSQSQSYEKTIFNSRVINSIYTGHNTVNLNRTNSTLADNKSIENFLNKISLYENEKGTKAKKEANKTNKKTAEKKGANKNKNKNINKNEVNTNTNINKKNSNLLVTSSLLTPATDSFLKKKINKKNLLENYLNNAINNINNNKLMFRPINNFQKQKSFSNIITNNKKKYGSINMKHNNVIKNINNNKNNNNNYSNSIAEANNLISKQNTSSNINGINGLFFNNIFNNNINDSYRSNNNININSYFDYDKYKKIILSTNNTSSHKIPTERVFSSPGRRQNAFFIKKRYKSSSKNKNKNINNNNNNNNNLTRKNISSNIFNKIQKKNKNNNNKNNNIYFREREEKKIFKCQISKQNQKKLINNFNPESVNKLYANNISNLNIKNKNNRNNNTFYNSNNNNNKSKIVNNYNIMSGIMNNSTQINIYTGNNLIKSLNLYWNSIINSTKGPSGVNDYNLYKKKSAAKSLSKKGKKIKNENLKKFLEKHWKEKKYKEPYTERNNNNEKILKLLDIYCRDAKKYKSTNIKKNISKNKLNKSHNYNCKYFSKNNLEVKSYNNNNNNNEIILKDKEKNNNINNNINHLILKKFSFYKKNNSKEGKKK